MSKIEKKRELISNIFKLIILFGENTFKVIGTRSEIFKDGE